jgi:hypothetical protein
MLQNVVEYDGIEPIARKYLVFEGARSDIETGGPSKFDRATTRLHSDCVPA